MARGRAAILVVFLACGLYLRFSMNFDYTSVEVPRPVPHTSDTPDAAGPSRPRRGASEANANAGPPAVASAGTLSGADRGTGPFTRTSTASDASLGPLVRRETREPEPLRPTSVAAPPPAPHPLPRPPPPAVPQAADVGARPPSAAQEPVSVGPGGRIGALPACDPLDTGAGTWVPTDTVAFPVPHLRHWYRPEACSLRVYSQPEALQCLRDTTVVYCGFSWTRNQWSALTGFLQDNHFWDFEQTPADAAKHPQCRTAPEARYVYNHNCHRYMHGHHIEGNATCLHAPGGVTCRRGGVPLGARGCSAYKMELDFDGCARMCAPRRPDFLVFGFHMHFILKVLRPETGMLQQALKGVADAVARLPGTQFIVHGIHERDMQRVPPQYRESQSNENMERFNALMRRHLPPLGVWYWHHYPLTAVRSGYRYPDGADGTHASLEVQLMKAQLLLNLICPNRTGGPAHRPGGPKR